MRRLLISVNSDYFQLNRRVERFVCGQLGSPNFETVVQDGLIIRKSYCFQIWKTNIYTAASKLPTVVATNGEFTEQPNATTKFGYLVQLAMEHN